MLNIVQLDSIVGLPLPTDTPHRYITARNVYKLTVSKDSKEYVIHFGQGVTYEGNGCKSIVVIEDQSTDDFLIINGPSSPTSNIQFEQSLSDVVRYNIMRLELGAYHGPSDPKKIIIAEVLLSALKSLGSYLGVVELPLDSWVQIPITMNTSYDEGTVTSNIDGQWMGLQFSMLRKKTGDNEYLSMYIKSSGGSAETIIESTSFDKLSGIYMSDMFSKFGIIAH